MGPHSKGDDLRVAEELEAIKTRDPLAAYGRLLAPEERHAIEISASEFIAAVHQQALDSPESKFTEVPRCFFSARADSPRTTPGVHAGPNVRATLNAALRDLLTNYENVLLLGEDLHDPYGGAFKVTAGLSSAFPGRVISTPISEAGITGAAIGLALAGFRPIVEIMFADFATLAMDQLYNHAVKFPGMFPDISIPLVIRTPSGGRRGYGPTHSQSIENLLTSVPGLTVVFPSERHNPGELLRSAVLHWPYPTVCLEHKLLYGRPVSAQGYRVVEPDPLDTGALLFPTLASDCHQIEPDITVVCYGHSVAVAEEAAARLKQEEIAVEIVIPSLLSPLPARTLTKLLAKRARVITLEEAPVEYGFAAELGAALLEAGYSNKRFLRLGPPAYPIPAARSLESSILPGADAVFDAAARMLLADMAARTQ
jgi:2-oxoisovalerate dehydrogenase E1 component